MPTKCTCRLTTTVYNLSMVKWITAFNIPHDAFVKSTPVFCVTPQNAIIFSLTISSLFIGIQKTPFPSFYFLLPNPDICCCFSRFNNHSVRLLSFLFTVSLSFVPRYVYWCYNISKKTKIISKSNNLSLLPPAAVLFWSNFLQLAYTLEILTLLAIAV